jgi:WD40 repeat protein
MTTLSSRTPTARRALALLVAVVPLLPVLAFEQAGDPAAEPTEFSTSGVSLIPDVDDVYTVAFSPDGKRIAAGAGSPDRPGDLSLYSVASRKAEWTQSKPHGVASACFSRDGKRLGWIAFDGDGHVLDLGSRKDAFTLPLEGRNRFAFSGDGKWLATAGENGRLRLFDAATGRSAGQFTGEQPAYNCVAFSRTSRFLAAGGARFNGAGPHLGLIFDVRTRKQVAKLEGHTRPVVAIAFGPGDALLATASQDNSVRLWEGRTWKLLHTLTGHTGMVRGLAFSPDGTLLATGSFDRTVRLWECRTGKPWAQLEGHPGVVRDLAFSPDGSLLVSGGGQRCVKLWDVKARKELATLRKDPPPDTEYPPTSLAVSPDGKLVATGSDAGAIALRDSLSGAVVRTLKGHSDTVSALAFSRDGSLLASCSPDGIVKLWAPSSGKEVRTLKGPDCAVNALAFSPDGKMLATGSYDRGVRLWQVKGGFSPRLLSGHAASVRAVAFSPDGNLLASGGSDREVRLWDTRTFAGKGELKGAGAVRGVAFSPDGRTVAAVGEDGFLWLWDPATLEVRNKVKAHNTSAALCLAYSPGGRLLVTGAHAGQIHFWDPEALVFRASRGAHKEGVTALAFGPGGRELFSLGDDRTLKRWSGIASPVRYFSGHKGPVRFAIASPDGKHLVSGGGWPEGDRTLRLWDLATGKEVRSFADTPGQMYAAVFTPDSKHVIAAGDSGMIRRWEVSSGKAVMDYQGHTEPANYLCLSADGKLLLSASNDRTVRLWDVETGKSERTFRGHTEWVRVCAFVPGGKRILSGGRDKTVRLWDIESGELIKRFKHDEVIEDIVALRDGRRFLANSGPAIHLWEMTKPTPVRTMEGHRYGVTCLALSHDERTLISGSYDNSVRCWDLATGRETARYGSHRNWVWGVAVTPDDKHFLSCGGGGKSGDNWVRGEDFTIRLWRLPGS